jgi:integrase
VVRERNGRWYIEIYDPETRKKRQLNQREIRALGFEPPSSERRAKRIERAALGERDARRPGSRDETCGSFAARWPDDYRRGHRGRLRSESTTEHNRERVARFGRVFADRRLRDLTRGEARAWANANPSTVNALRAMFSDALEDHLVDENPFARLGLDQSRGREAITVLTVAELNELVSVARRMHGDRFGPEVAAVITWAAYTCMRPGEIFAARYSLLNGDEYELQRQMNSRLGRETEPKHSSAGAIYVPEPARRAVLEKPRRLHDDLIFRGKRGQQLRQESWHRAWDQVRNAFVSHLPETHHLRRRLSDDPDDRFDFYELRHFGASYMLNALGLEPWVIAQQLRHSDGGSLVVELYGHPERAEAIKRIRRAYGENVRPIGEASGEDMGKRGKKSAS